MSVRRKLGGIGMSVRRKLGAEPTAKRFAQANC